MTWPLLIALGLGLRKLGRLSLIPAASTILLILLYLPYAHFAEWTLYYMEALPFLALAAALGIGKLGGIGLNGRDPAAGRQRSLALRLRYAAARVGIAVAACIGLLQLAFGWVKSGDERDLQRRYRALSQALPGERVTVFVRYKPSHISHLSLITNGADLQSQRVWSVYDLGAENRMLLEHAPDRHAYVYDESRWAFTRIR